MADNTYMADNGSSGSTDGTFSFGSTGSNDRAFGGFISNPLYCITTIGAQFTNNTGYMMTQLPITYTGEQWRTGIQSFTDKFKFSYSTDATSLTTGTWTDVSSLDFNSPVTTAGPSALDGNALANRTNISYTISGLSISNGTTFWIRWIDVLSSPSEANDHALAIDDFSINESLLPVELSSFSALIIDKGVRLNWQTATEVNNYGFSVERRTKSDEWEKIGFVQGHGNSNSPKEYSFTDNNLQQGNIQYRLKQIDNDGSFTYSNVVETSINELPKTFGLFQNYPNPFNPTTKITYQIPENLRVTLKLFDIIGNEVATLVNENKSPGSYEVILEANYLQSGIYFYRLQAGKFTTTKKLILMK